MDSSKCDLSSNEAVLDFEAMLTTAYVAVGNCVENISRYKDKVRAATFPTTEDITALHLNAYWLAREAKHLTTAADVLATLIGAKTREVIKVTNHNPTLELED